MKTLFALLFSFSFLISQGQENSGNLLFMAIGKTLSKKDYKELAGMNCIVTSRIQVVSEANDISFSLIIESQALKSIDIRRDFLTREPYQLNPILEILPGLTYKETFELVKKNEGVSKLSKYNEESRYFSFYYSPEQTRNNLFFNIYFKKDDSEQLIVDRISFSKTKD